MAEGLSRSTAERWEADGRVLSRGNKRTLYLRHQAAREGAFVDVRSRLYDRAMEGSVAAMRLLLYPPKPVVEHSHAVHHDGSVAQVHEGSVEVAATVEVSVQPLFTREDIAAAAGDPETLGAMAALAAAKAGITIAEG